MSKHYYIISFDTHYGEWELDTEAERNHFPDGTILDIDGDGWFHDYSGDGEFHPDAERLSEQITKAINQLNEGLKS